MNNGKRYLVINPITSGAAVRFLSLGLVAFLGLIACDSQSPTKTAQSTDCDTGSFSKTTQPPNSDNKPDITVGTGDTQSTTTQSGLRFLFLQTSDGPKPQPGEVVAVHYTAALEDGTVFDSSRQRDEPLHFALGKGLVIRGWEEGIALMTLGSKIRLFIPPQLAYGSRGSGDVIPPNATLVFEVELLSIRPGTPNAPTPVCDHDLTTTESGLQYIDFIIGQGEFPQTGQEVQVHFTAWLKSGRQIQTTLDLGTPFSFPFSQAPIPGWDEGVATMQVGGHRQLVIPPQLAFGKQGSGIVPANATLIIEVELLELR